MCHLRPTGKSLLMLKLKTARVASDTSTYTAQRTGHVSEHIQKEYTASLLVIFRILIVQY